MKVLIRKDINDIGYETSLAPMLQYRFPVVNLMAEVQGHIDVVNSRDYQSLTELFAVRMAVEMLDSKEEFVIKTKADYNKFVILVNDFMVMSDFGAVLQIGDPAKKEA